MRKYKPFTEEELKIINESSGKISLYELSKKLNYNYTVLSGKMKYCAINFIKKNRVKRYKDVEESSEMNKVRNEKRQLLLTDAHLKEWFKPY